MIPFFTIILVNVFALIAGYFFSTFKLKPIANNEYEHPSIITALLRNLILVILSSIIVGAIIAYVGLQSIQLTSGFAIVWTVLIIAMTLVLTLLYYALILRFNTIGMMIIGLTMMLYFLTNGALGMGLLESRVFSLFHTINPLTTFESPLVSLVGTSSLQVWPTIMMLLITLILSLVTLFAFHPKSE